MLEQEMPIYTEFWSIIPQEYFNDNIYDFPGYLRASNLNFQRRKTMVWQATTASVEAVARSNADTAEIDASRTSSLGLPGAPDFCRLSVFFHLGLEETLTTCCLP